MEYSEKEPESIKLKLKSGNVELVKEGINQLKMYVDKMGFEVDLSIFGYESSEGIELLENNLFDNILETFGKELGQETLLNLIYSLLNENEEYIDCKATVTAAKILLKNRTDKIEIALVNAFKRGCKHYEPGHRGYENGLLDVFIEQIFPTFKSSALFQLLKWAHVDMLFDDDLISLVPICINNCTNADQEREISTFLIKLAKAHYRLENLDMLFASFKFEDKQKLGRKLKRIINAKKAKDKIKSQLRSNDLKQMHEALNQIGETYPLSKVDTDYIQLEIHDAISGYTEELDGSVISSLIYRVTKQLAPKKKRPDGLMQHLIRYAFAYHKEATTQKIVKLAHELKNKNDIIEVLNGCKQSPWISCVRNFSAETDAKILTGIENCISCISSDLI